MGFLPYLSKPIRVKVSIANSAWDKPIQVTRHVTHADVQLQGVILATQLSPNTELTTYNTQLTTHQIGRPPINLQTNKTDNTERQKTVPWRQF